MSVQNNLLFSVNIISEDMFHILPCSSELALWGQWCGFCSEINNWNYWMKMLNVILKYKWTTVVRWRSMLTSWRSKSNWDCERPHSACIHMGGPSEKWCQLCCDVVVRINFLEIIWIYFPDLTVVSHHHHFISQLYFKSSWPLNIGHKNSDSCPRHWSAPR